MSHDPHHEEIESLLGAYALDAVDPEEALVIERHLLECPRCRAEVDAHTEMASALGSSVEPLPDGLWDAIASRLNSAARDVGRDPVRPTTPARATSGPDVVPIEHARRRRTGDRRRWFPGVAAAVAVAAVAVIAVLGVDLARSNGRVHQLTSAISRQGDAGSIAAALDTPGHRLVTLKTPQGVEAAQFVLLPDGRGYLVSSRVPGLPADETYQLWAMISGQPISIGLLGNQPSRGAFTVARSASPSELELTIEPAGGVATPDRAAVAAGPVSA
jgi:anti-sigma-K factor RskA